MICVSKRPLWHADSIEGGQNLFSQNSRVGNGGLLEWFHQHQPIAQERTLPSSENGQRGMQASAFPKPSCPLVIVVVVIVLSNVTHPSSISIESIWMHFDWDFTNHPDGAFKPVGFPRNHLLTEDAASELEELTSGTFTKKSQTLT